MERNWKGKLSKSKTRERIGKLSNYFREERKGLLSKIIGQVTMYGEKCLSVHSSTTALIQKLAKENEDAAAVVRKASIVVGATGNRYK